MTQFPPPLQAEGKSIPEAWENSYLELANKGVVYKRRDEKDSGDQIEAKMTTVITNPDSDPFSHLSGGTNALDAPLLDYCMEMLGAKDTWVRDFNDPEDKRWEYMYHERLASYPTQKGPLNQINFAIKKLIENPSSRKTNIITWYPERDTTAEHTPCLQRQWFQIIAPQDSEEWLFDMHYDFRSRNVVNASFGNILGLYVQGCHMRDKVEEATGKQLPMRMIDNVNSFHVNSKEYNQFLNLATRIKKQKEEGGLENRTWSREEVIAGLELAREKVEKDIIRQTAKYFKEDLEVEKQRVHDIGDRVFYLLNKYGK
jgi:thymidylate synthase